MWAAGEAQGGLATADDCCVTSAIVGVVVVVVDVATDRLSAR